jgi:gluconolactonase
VTPKAIASWKRGANVKTIGKMHESMQRHVMIGVLSGLAAGFFGCSGSSTSPQGQGGSDVGGSSSSVAGGSSAGGDATGGGLPTGGAVQTGGQVATGGATAANGGSIASTGGSKSTGGTSEFGGATVGTGGNTNTAGSSSVGGRGTGICPGGTYPAPDLSATASVVTSDTKGGQYEGVLWFSSQGVLLVSGMDTTVSGTTIVPTDVLKVTPPNTVSTAVANVGTNGLAVDFSGTVLACSQGTAQRVAGVVSIDLTSSTVTNLVSTDANGHHFNSPNDLTVRTDGTIYFTDPDYQIAGRANETGIKGVYRITPSSHQVSLVDGTFNEPNGIALSADETVLYVADTGANAIRRFSVAADGSTGNKQNFASMTSPDGVAVDCAGNTYWASNTTPGKIVVFSAAGTQLGTIALGASDKPTNVAFGGTDHKTLYVSTSPRKIYSATLNIPGFPY